MKREWKPGDVAMVTFDNASYAMHQKGETDVVTMIGLRREDDWGLPSYGSAIGDDLVTDARPLVAIDLPKGALAGWPVLIDALRQAREATGYHMIFDGLIEQIEQQTADPKPEEPTDPQARVTDRRDNIWRLLADGDWVCTSGPDVGEYLNWDQLAGDRGPVSIEATP